jgi:RNA polymerase sigma-70 factor (ECF subfamily)
MNLRRRVRAGDPDAFRELFDAYARSVYNHAYRLTGDWSAAEDVVSLTYLEAWRLRDRVELGDGAGSLRPWLLGIATNVGLNFRRAARRHADALTRLPRAELVPDPADEVAARLDGRDQIARTVAALHRLRSSEREVLALAWSGLDHAETAQALGVAVGTVRSRLSRARRRLARLAAAGQPEAGGVDHSRQQVNGYGQVQSDRDRAVRLAQESAR